MYAIVRQGGKQYRVAAGDELVCDRVRGEVGEPFVFEKHLLISDDGQTVVTDEQLAEYSIKAELVEHFDDKKVLVFKYKAKKGYRRTHGHRQAKSRVKILAIEKAGKTAAKTAPDKTKAGKSEVVKVAPTVEKASTKKTAPVKTEAKTKATKTKSPAQESESKTDKKPAAKKKADTEKEG